MPGSLSKPHYSTLVTGLLRDAHAAEDVIQEAKSPVTFPFQNVMELWQHSPRR